MAHRPKEQGLRHPAVKRRLVTSPDQWAFSSFRFYHLGDVLLLAMDRLP
jgi:hypothetical protein